LGSSEWTAFAAEGFMSDVAPTSVDLALSSDATDLVHPNDGAVTHNSWGGGGTIIILKNPPPKFPDPTAITAYMVFTGANEGQVSISSAVGVDGLYSINGAAFTSVNGQVIHSGDTLRIKATPSQTVGADVQVLLGVSG